MFSKVSPALIDQLQLECYRVDHYPIVRAYMQKLGLIELIDELVGSRMKVSPGLVVAGMVQDTLSGRSPLYRLEEFFAQQDSELVVGTAVKKGSFNDDNVGRVMDKLYDIGTMKIFSEVSQRAVTVFSLDLSCTHQDTTSVSVWGDYDLYNSDCSSLLKITHGHSKDKRPDLKQFLLNILCVEQNIPILGRCEDGNTSDKKVHNKILTEISKYLGRNGIADDASIYISDSAVVTEDNLAYLKNKPFITRLPFNYNEADSAVAEAVKNDKWEDVGVIARTKPTKNRPVASYRIAESRVTLYGQEYRAVVVHSSAYDKRRQKRIDRELRKARQALEATLRKLPCFYHCREDAEAAAQRVEKVTSAYYSIKAHVTEEICYGPGRPPKNGVRKIKSRRYKIKTVIREKEDELLKKREEAGCFVMLTNIPKAPEDTAVQQDQSSSKNDAIVLSAENVLRHYKEQHGIERNFGFLKDPLIVNDLFLKKPQRIEALGLILLISLLIWNLIERSMRQHLKETGETLVGWDNKPTQRPTAFMMTIKFAGIMIIKSNDIRITSLPLNPVHIAYLAALKLSPRIFTNPKPG